MNLIETFKIATYDLKRSQNTKLYFKFQHFSNVTFAFQKLDGQTNHLLYACFYNNISIRSLNNTFSFGATRPHYSEILIQIQDCNEHPLMQLVLQR